MQLPLEAVQEFQISTQRFSAENGRSQGAAINMITKSGTNTYHGSIFGYFRNSALDTDEKVANGDGSIHSRAPRLQPPVVRRFGRRSVCEGQALRLLRHRTAAREPGALGGEEFLLPNWYSLNRRDWPRSQPYRFLGRFMSGAITVARTGTSTKETQLISATAHRRITA